MRHSGLFTARRIANCCVEIQIVDTGESSETTIDLGFATDRAPISRTLLILNER
jgi:hypothetical protein